MKSKIIILMGCLLIILSGCTVSEIDTYTSKNMIEFSKFLGNGYDKFNNYNFFFLENNEAIEENLYVNFEFIKYFYNEHGINDIFIDKGYSTANFLTLWLAGEYDKNPLAFGDSENNKLYLDFWDKVKEFNGTLPKDKKLKFYGVFVENNMDNVEYIKRMKPENKTPSSNNIKEFVNAFEEMDFSNKEAYINNFVLFNDEYKEYYGDFFSEYEIIFRQSYQYLTSMYGKNELVKEGYLKENFMKIYSSFNEDRKILGILKNSHIKTNSQVCDTTCAPDVDTLAKTLNSEYPFSAEKVASIVSIDSLNLKDLRKDEYTAFKKSIKNNTGFLFIDDSNELFKENDAFKYSNFILFFSESYKK